MGKGQNAKKEVKKPKKAKKAKGVQVTPTVQS